MKKDNRIIQQIGSYKKDVGKEIGMKNILHQAEVLLEAMGQINFTEEINPCRSDWDYCVYLWDAISKELDILEAVDRMRLLAELFQLTEREESPGKIDSDFILQMALCDKLDIPKYINHVIERIYEANNISNDTKHFLYWQVQMQTFSKSPFVLDEHSRILLKKIYRKLFMELAGNYHLDDKCGKSIRIPTEDRNTDLVLITIGQFGEVSHPLTQTTLDCCNILANKYHKKILLVETAEFGSLVDAIPLLKCQVANHCWKSVIASSIQYNNISIPFIQTNTEWTMRERCDSLINIVHEKKPLFILNIGGNSLATDICSYMIPTYTSSELSSGHIDSSEDFSAALEEFYQSTGIGKEYWYSKEGLPAESTSFLFREQRSCYFDYDIKFDMPIPQELKEKYHYEKEDAEPVFSIMMAVYNDTSLLNTAINSLLRQEFKSWELLILDNSDKTDKAWNMIQNAAELDGRIYAYKSEKSIGWAGAASFLLEKAMGHYVTFLSADDCLNFEALMKLNSVIEREEPDIVFVGNGYVRYYLENDGEEQVELLKVQKPAYKVWEKSNRSEAMVDIMHHVYYNSMFHYCRTEFLRKYHIDFFRPYYGDCAGMTHAMAKADKIVVLNELIYYLTRNTSQTSGYYVWDSYKDVCARQWNSIKEIFESELCYERNLISYAVCRIWNDFTARMGILCTGRCRDKYMNSIEVNRQDILGQLEDAFLNKALLEMALIMGEQGMTDLLNHISKIRSLYTDAAGKDILNRSWLSGFIKVAVESDGLSSTEKLKYIIDFLLQEKNYMCLGIGYMIELTNQCSDVELAAESYRIPCVIEKYDEFMSRLDDIWLAKVFSFL